MTGKQASRQRGYALPEVLVAAVIAAGVLTAAASAISGVVRLSVATNQRAHTLDEAKLIAARLRAGMDEKAALEGLAGWRLEHSPFEESAASRLPAPFDLVTVSHEARDGFEFSLFTRKRVSAP